MGLRVQVLKSACPPLNPSSNLNLIDRSLDKSPDPLCLCFLHGNDCTYLIGVVSIHFEHKMCPQNNFLCGLQFPLFFQSYACYTYRGLQKRKQQNLSSLRRKHFALFCSHENEIINQVPPLPHSVPSTVLGSGERANTPAFLEQSSQGRTWVRCAAAVGVLVLHPRKRQTYSPGHSRGHHRLLAWWGRGCFLA